MSEFLLFQNYRFLTIFAGRLTVVLWPNSSIYLEKIIIMIKFMLLFSRQGKVRLQKWFNAIGDKERKKITRELVSIILARRPKMCNFLDWKDLKV